MKKFFFLLLFPYLLTAEYLVVSSNPTGSVSDGTIRIDNISGSIGSNLIIGSGSQTKEVPLYMNSDSTKAVSLKFSNLSNLSNGSDEIGVTLYYRTSTGTYTVVNSGDIVTLQGNRDGNSIVGYLKVVTDAIADDQTFGDYTFNDTTSVALDSSWSTNSSLSINANIALVAVAGLSSTSSYTVGEKFVDSSVNFGTFSLGEVNIIDSSLYVKSNSDEKFKITFTSTPPLLLDGTDTDNDIPISYYYNNNLIEANLAFEAFSGKNRGESAIGTFQFKTNTISDSTIAGEYSVSISVNVSAQ